MTYDANPEEQQRLRRVLSKQLNRVQNSVFAGNLRRLETETLCKELEETVEGGRVHVWISAHPPDLRLIGTQQDQESPIV